MVCHCPNMDGKAVKKAGEPEDLLRYKIFYSEI